MTIYNFDAVFGTRVLNAPFDQQTTEQMALFNHDNLDIQQARTRANEILRVTGAKVLVYLRTDNADYDRVFNEDPNPTYWAAIPLYSFYAPKPMEMEMKKWGPDVKISDRFTFSYEQVYEVAKDRMLRTGDIIRIDYNAGLSKIDVKNFRVVNGSPAGNFKYNWLYWVCDVENLTGDITVQPENDEEMMPIDDDALQPGYSEGSA